MKLPVAFTLGNREASLDRDPLMKNALAEPSEQEGVVKARKRPAIDSAFTAATGQGQALFTWTTPGPLGPQETLVAITDDIINTAPTVINKALRFVQQPTDDGIGEVITPAVTVEAVDRAGNRVTSYSGAVSVSLGANPTGATLGGDTSNNASSGIATFNDLELNRSGSGFTLSATASGLRSATSSAFSIPTELVFTQQPSNGNPGETLDPIEVTAKDEDGNTDTNFTGNVTLSLYSNSSGGTLSGTTTVTAVAGVATFSNLEIDELGVYTLKASGTEVSTAYKPADVVSNSFAVGYVLGAASGLGGFGYISGVSGTLSPDTLNSVSVTVLGTFDIGGVKTWVTLDGTRSQDFFTSITVSGTTLLTANAQFSQGGLNTSWLWDEVLFPSAGTYLLVFE